jgi:fumarate hydratase subunit beta
MRKKIRIATPLKNSTINDLKAGDLVLLSGTIYTARDAAHKRMLEDFQRGDPLPFEVENQIVYYVGMCPTKPGFTAGSAGPTTSGRMDKYTIPLLQMGLKGMIGKGEREGFVIEAMQKHNCVYFGAIGGAAVLIANAIKKVETVAYEDLGTEAIKKLSVEDMPLIVVIDKHGNNLYDTEPSKYKKNRITCESR